MLKKIILLSFAIFFHFKLIAQVKICQLPQTNTGSTSDYIIKEDVSCVNGTRKMTIANFISTYGLGGGGGSTPSGTNYVLINNGGLLDTAVGFTFDPADLGLNLYTPSMGNYFKTGATQDLIMGDYDGYGSGGYLQLNGQGDAVVFNFSSVTFPLMPGGGSNGIVKISAAGLLSQSPTIDSTYCTKNLSSIIRKVGSDSVFVFRNGVKTFAYKDSIGSGGGSVDTSVLVTKADRSQITGVKTFTNKITGVIDSSVVLRTARTINGTSFNGSANVTIPVNSVDDVSTTGPFPILWTQAAGNSQAYISSGELLWDPDVNRLTAPGFIGALIGNASTVTNGVYTIGTQSISGLKTFDPQSLKIANSGTGFKHIISAATIAGDRIMTLPTVTSDATFAVNNIDNTFTAQQTITNIGGYGFGFHAKSNSSSSYGDISAENDAGDRTEVFTLGTAISQSGVHVNKRGGIVSSSTAGLSIEAGGTGGVIVFATNASLTERMRLDASGKLGIGVAAPTAILHLKAGTTAATTAPLKFNTGGLMTTPEQGAVEFDSVNTYMTNETTSGRGAIPVDQYFHLTSAGSTISTIANYFGTTSNIPLVANAYYEIEITCYFLKTTLGTVTWTFTNSAAPTGQNIASEFSPITGIVTGTPAGPQLKGNIYNDATAAKTIVSGMLSDATDHFASFKIFLKNGSGTSLKIQATSSAGTITPGIGSTWHSRRISPNNVGTFAN